MREKMSCAVLVGALLFGVEGYTVERKRVVFEDKKEWLQARLQDVTSTEVSALFGANPWLTHFELWREKKGRVIREIPDNPRMVWGRRLEEAIARGVAEDEGWNIRACNAYERIPALRIGSSFDFRILGEPKAILEIKTVDSWIFKKTWIEHPDGTIEPPPYMEFQLQHEMLVSGYEQAFLYALVGGNCPVMVHRKADPRFHEAIIAKVSEFWASIDANEEPAPDYTRDGAAIRDKFSMVNPDSVLNAIGDGYMTGLCARDVELAELLKDKQGERDAVRAELLDRIGHNEVALVDGHVVTCRASKTGKRTLLVRPEKKEA